MYEQTPTLSLQQTLVTTCIYATWTLSNCMFFKSRHKNKTTLLFVLWSCSTEISLKQRLEYIARAILSAKSSSCISAQASDGEFLHELEEKMEVRMRWWSQWKTSRRDPPVIFSVVTTPLLCFVPPASWCVSKYRFRRPWSDSTPIIPQWKMSSLSWILSSWTSPR